MSHCYGPDGDLIARLIGHGPDGVPDWELGIDDDPGWGLDPFDEDWDEDDSWPLEVLEGWELPEGPDEDAAREWAEATRDCDWAAARI